MTKLRLLFPFLLCGLIATAAAQEPPAWQARLQQLSQQLNLTESQKEKLKPILRNEAEQVESVRNDTSLTKQQKWAKVHDIHESFEPKVDAVLTPEQQQKLQQMKAQAKEHAHSETH